MFEGFQGLNGCLLKKTLVVEAGVVATTVAVLDMYIDLEIRLSIHSLVAVNP